MLDTYSYMCTKLIACGRTFVLARGAQELRMSCLPCCWWAIRKGERRAKTPWIFTGYCWCRSGCPSCCSWTGGSCIISRPCSPCAIPWRLDSLLLLLVLAPSSLRPLHLVYSFNFFFSCIAHKPVAPRWFCWPTSKSSF